MAEFTPRRFRLIVFDWDGTLADSTAIITDAIRLACGDVGAAIPDRATARYVIGLGLADAIRHVAPGLAPADQRRLSERYRHHYLSRDAEIPLFEGASELLDSLDAELRTGRTHQIRVHLTHLGFPLAGDDKYGDFAWNRELAREGLKRMFLHARSLTLAHPVDGTTLRLEAPLPADLSRYLARLGAQATHG